ncbi:LamG-like jellyroll fold domain-containing protein [Autumnicola edwardsiae]|uniref:LamG-like jellyroll fold domain-containing protein n=1 Tax=Autumnicola edwardsiae TaxID=3075594 RepID=A0ABU3CVX1_9FLAO|nr:LamG-like jellyroll fold domain-containing protein [Zunongwangia sp. F297]MDT0650411.1 LamG-like jellyroll fold domain-containing protein [Zunongwangia sp. F297]
MKKLIYLFLCLSNALFSQNFHYVLNPPTNLNNCEANPRGLQFDGVDDWVDIPDINLTGDFTIEFWAKLEGEITHEDAVLGQIGRGPDINFDWKKVRIYVPNEGSAGRVIYANQAITPGQWNHFAFVRKGTSMSLFINGVKDITTNSYWSGNFPIEAIGRGNAGFFGGRLDEVKIWNRALSYEEIANNYGQSNISDNTGLLAYYDFNETGKEVLDLSGKTGKGTLGGSLSTGNDDPKRSKDVPDLCNYLPQALVSLTENSYTLKRATTTSAGVYAEDGTLVRTLWNNKQQQKGTHSFNWDKKDDAGNAVSSGSYNIKLLTNNLIAEWEGPIGNNSPDLTGERVQTSYEQLRTMSIVGDEAYLAAGFNEGKASQWKINLNDPNVRIPIKVLKEGVFGNGQETEYSTTDGKTVYYGGYDDWGRDKVSFIFGIDPLDDSFQEFSKGRPYTTAAGGDTYDAAFGIMTDDVEYDKFISGMAVQRDGDYLFVSYLNLNQISVYNKTTGSLIRTIAVEKPRLLTIDSHGNGNLWIQYNGNEVSKYKINSDGSFTSTGVKISGKNKIHALGSDFTGKIVAIADGETQTVKRFSTANGSLLNTFGQKGGYATNPTVKDDKFYFSDSRDDSKLLRGAKTFITYEADGSYWLGDTHNRRVLHFSATDKLLDKIEYQGEVRSATVDPNDPTRVFADYMEFKVDYNKNIGGNNGSWKTVRNWRYHTIGFENWYYKLRFVYTLPNGRTYAQINPSKSDDPFVIFELDPDFGLRNTGIKLPKGGAPWVLDWFLRSDGSLRKYTITGPEDSRTVTWQEAPLTGFDSDHNPQWGSLEIFAQLKNQDKLQPYHRYGIFQNTPPVPDVSENGVLVSYENHHPDLGTTGYHLGGMKPGTDKWLWKAMPSTPENYSGPFPTDGRYDIGNGVHYPGGPAIVIDDIIFAGYHGELWKNSTANMWYIYRDDGLMLKLFGALGPDVANESTPYGSAGNALSANAVKIGEDYYLYHADENAHGGVNRWRISNIDNIQEQIICVEVK